MTEKEGDVLLEKLDEVGETLKPYFDSVLILCTYRVDDKTMYQIKEVGNSFANSQIAENYVSGELREWIENEE
jgi:hypothetical protein